MFSLNQNAHSNICTFQDSFLKSGPPKIKKIRKRRHIPHCERTPEFVKHRNNREKNRVQKINAAFENLRKCVPSLSDEEDRPSKVEILYSAMQYINSLGEMLKESENVSEQCMVWNSTEQQNYNTWTENYQHQKHLISNNQCSKGMTDITNKQVRFF